MHVIHHVYFLNYRYGKSDDVHCWHSQSRISTGNSSFFLFFLIFVLFSFCHTIIQTIKTNTEKKLNTKVETLNTNNTTEHTHAKT